MKLRMLTPLLALSMSLSPAFAQTPRSLNCTLFANAVDTTDGITLTLTLPAPDYSNGGPHWEALRGISMDPETAKAFDDLPLWINKISIGTAGYGSGLMLFLTSGESVEMPALQATGTFGTRHGDLTLLSNGYLVALSCHPAR